MRTVDIASAPYPLKFAFGGAAHGLNPYINIINRLQVVQFEDFEGELRTLAYEPTVTEGPQEAPFYEQMMQMPGDVEVPDWLAYKVIAKIWNEPDQALARSGCGPRTSTSSASTTSTSRTSASSSGRRSRSTARPRRARRSSRTRSCSPSARSGTRSPRIHPMQWAWYVGDGVKDVPTENVILLDGDVELGQGRGAGLDARPHRRQPLARGQHRRAASGSAPRTASAPTTGTRTSRGSRA